MTNIFELFNEVISADDSTEPYVENGRTITLKSMSPELHLVIVKLIAGMGYYLKKRYYFEEIEKIARKEGLSDYAVGMLIKQAAKKALLSYSKVSRLLPDKYKDKQKQKAARSGVEQRRSSACNMQANDSKNAIEESEIDKRFRSSPLYQRMNNEIRNLQSDLQQLHHAKYMIARDALTDFLQTTSTKHSEDYYLESQFVECQFAERVSYGKNKSIVFLGLKDSNEKDTNIENLLV
jgi:hypothetical protein